MTPSATNGQQITQQDAVRQVERARVEQQLTQPLTEGYQSTLPLWALEMENLPQFYLHRDVELMLIHPVVLNALNYFKSGIAGVEFEGPLDPADPGGAAALPVSPDPNVSSFVTAQCQRFWARGVPKVQGGYEYGWIGCEALYAERSGFLVWDDLRQFSPRDTYLLTIDKRPVGVRVKNVRDKGQVDLFTASRDVPCKGLWYVHEPRYHAFYGQSQLLGAWRPWRRLAFKNGVESVADMGVYRFGVPGPVVGYPDEDMQSANQAPATTLDSQGFPRRYARDVARQLAEWYKSGAGIGLPSTTYSPDLGGGPKWTLDIPKSTLNIDGLIAYVKHLWDQIYYGVGVPPELLAAAETGSGYSGRKIPREAFLSRQQRLADAILDLFVSQVLRPLVRWNFGDVPFTVRVKDLLKSERLAQTGGPGVGQEAPGDQGAVPPQPGEPQVNPAVPPQPGMFSLQHPALITDRVRDIARRILAGRAA